MADYRPKSTWVEDALDPRLRIGSALLAATPPRGRHGVSNLALKLIACHSHVIIYYHWCPRLRPTPGTDRPYRSHWVGPETARDTAPSATLCVCVRGYPHPHRTCDASQREKWVSPPCFCCCFSLLCEHSPWRQLFPFFTLRHADVRFRPHPHAKQMGPVGVNGSVHTARKQHQRVCVQICARPMLCVNGESGQSCNKRPAWANSAKPTVGPSGLCQQLVSKS